MSIHSWIICTVIDDDSPEMFDFDEQEGDGTLPTTNVLIRTQRYHQPHKTYFHAVSRRQFPPRRKLPKTKLQPKPNQNVIVTDNRFFQLSSSIALSLRVIVLALALAVPFFVINFIVISIKLFVGLAMVSTLNILTLALVLWDFLTGGKPHVKNYQLLKTRLPHWNHLPFLRRPDHLLQHLQNDDDVDDMDQE